MKLTLALGILVAASSAFAQINYSNSQDLDIAHRDFRITDAKYVMIPTKTEIREIPGCNPHGEASQICTEEVVLESKPVVQVEVAYTEGVFRDPEYNRGEGWTTFNFDVATFSAADVEYLKKNTSIWDLGGKTRNRRAFAAKHFELVKKVETRTIQVVDVRNSKLCPVHGESGEVYDPTCEEVIVYKDALIKVNNITINRK